MKVTEESQSRLEFTDNAYRNYFVGVIAIIISVALLFFSNPFSQQNGIIIMIFVAVFFLAGLFFILSRNLTTIVFDKNSDSLTFIKKGLVGTKREEFTLSQIARVDLRQDYGSTAGYQVNLVMKDGKELVLLRPAVRSRGSRARGLDLTQMFRLFSAGSERRMIAQKAAAFLGISLHEGPSSLTQAVGTISSVFKKRPTPNG